MDKWTNTLASDKIVWPFCSNYSSSSLIKGHAFWKMANSRLFGIFKFCKTLYVNQLVGFCSMYNLFVYPMAFSQC